MHAQSQSCELPREQNRVHDRLCYLRAEMFASDVVGPEMLTGIDSAQARLLRCRREAGEVALHSLQRLGCDLKSESITKLRLQDFGSGKTDGTMGTGVGRIRSGLGRQRKPIRIGLGVGIAVIAGQ